MSFSCKTSSSTLAAQLAWASDYVRAIPVAHMCKICIHVGRTLDYQRRTRHPPLSCTFFPGTHRHNSPVTRMHLSQHSNHHQTCHHRACTWLDLEPGILNTLHSCSKCTFGPKLLSFSCKPSSNTSAFYLARASDLEPGILNMLHSCSKCTFG